jgi:imidazolonepropionase-like amidohydrolase
VFDQDLKVVHAMRRIGVRFIAGTDGPFAEGGAALHEELVLLVKAGFSPMEALQAATRNAAEFVSKLPILGTIETGKIADLVLLGANPLDDIANTRTIVSVVTASRLINNRELRNFRSAP